MSETKELIKTLNRCMAMFIPHWNDKDKVEHIENIEEIKSILEQQYQHEQNILNYGTDEPEEQQVQNTSEPDEELVEYFDGICLFLANHGFTEVDQRAVAIRKLLKGEKCGT